MLPSDSLPYEIISEILSPLLKVPDELFADNSPISPFAQYSHQSTAAYLAVCKKWLHAATPLLYHVVVLRSVGQAEALALTLATHNGLGNHIRKLRVEGGYGDSMLTILASAPNITDLYLSLEIWGANSTTGLCQGLPLINPTRLIINEGGSLRRSKQVTNLIGTIRTAIVESWDHLTFFVSPYIYARDSDGRAALFFESLAQAARVQTVVTPREDCLDWVYPLVKSCPLQHMGFNSRKFWWYHRHAKQGSLRDPALKQLIRNYELVYRPRSREAEFPQSVDEDSAADASTSTPFSPMGSQPLQLQESIWSRILQLTMALPERDWRDVGLLSLRTSRLSILCVSKMFYRLGRSSYYSNLSFFGSPANLDRLNKLLSEPDLQIKTFYSVRFRTKPLPWDLFERLLSRSGTTLQDCGAEVDAAYNFGEELTPPTRIIDATEIFSRVPSLRRLRWACKAVFHTPDETNAGEIPKLEALWIHVTDPTFLDALAAARLPSLTTLYATTNTVNYVPFLSAHGASLTVLHISCAIVDEMWAQSTGPERLSALCPCLTELSVLWPDQFGRPYPPRNAFLPFEWRADTPALSRRRRSVAISPPPVTSKFQSLTKITLQMRWFPHPSEASKLGAWGEYLLKFDATECPALQELSVPRLMWPVKERDIDRSLFVQAAERMLECGIYLAGNNGVRWRPRL